MFYKKWNSKLMMVLLSVLMVLACGCGLDYPSDISSEQTAEKKTEISAEKTMDTSIEKTTEASVEKTVDKTEEKPKQEKKSKDAIDLTPYFRFGCRQYDGYAKSVSGQLDINSLMADYGDKIQYNKKGEEVYGDKKSESPANILRKAVSFTFDITEDFSNGDEIPYHVFVDDSVSEYLNCELYTPDGIYIAEGLEPITWIDPFEKIHAVRINEYTGEPEYYFYGGVTGRDFNTRDADYALQYDGLEDGDTVTLWFYLDADMGETIEEMAKFFSEYYSGDIEPSEAEYAKIYGIRFTSFYKKYKVSGKKLIEIEE